MDGRVLGESEARQVAGGSVMTDPIWLQMEMRRDAEGVDEAFSSGWIGKSTERR